MSINSSPGTAFVANQIILFIFARAVYDALNYIAMVTANAVSLTDTAHLFR